MLLPAHADDYQRAVEADAAGDWSDDDKWTPIGVPNTTADTAIFNIGPTERSVTLDLDATVDSLRVGYNPGADAQAGHLRLEGGPGHLLSVGDLLNPGSILVGAGTATTTGTATGMLVIGSGVEMVLAGSGSAFYVGGHSANTTSSNGAGATSGSVTMETGTSLTLGAVDARAQWFVGRQTTIAANTATGNVSGSGGGLEAYLSTLVVGQNVRGSNRADDHNASGTLDLSGLESAAIDTEVLIVGRSTESSAHGSITLGSGQSLAVGTATEGTVQIGVRDTGQATANLRVGEAIGSVVLQAGSELSIGVSGNHAEVALGQNGGSRGGTMIAQGSIVAQTGSSFSGYFSSLTLGRQSREDANILYRATGILDLREAAISAFEASGDVTIGNGPGEGSQGELRLSSMEGSISGNLTVGDDKTGGGSQVGSSGLLELTGAQLSVEGGVNLLQTGQVMVTLTDRSAGLRLGADATLSISGTGGFLGDPLAGYYIDFSALSEDATGLYYGLAWEGNHLTELSDMVESFAITWNGGNQYGLHYSEDLHLTYIGIPEPSSALIFLVGGVGTLLWLRRQGRSSDLAGF